MGGLIKYSVPVNLTLKMLLMNGNEFTYISVEDLFIYLFIFFFLPGKLMIENRT